MTLAEKDLEDSTQLWEEGWTRALVEVSRKGVEMRLSHLRIGRGLLARPPFRGVFVDVHRVFFFFFFLCFHLFVYPMTCDVHLLYSFRMAVPRWWCETGDYFLEQEPGLCLSSI